MGCAEKDCCTKGVATGAIAFPGTNEPNTPWKLYNHLIAGIPEDVWVPTGPTWKPTVAWG